MISLGTAQPFVLKSHFAREIAGPPDDYVTDRVNLNEFTYLGGTFVHAQRLKDSDLRKTDQ